MGFLIESFIFILILGFTHLICMSVQVISGRSYFYGVYTNQIDIDSNTKNKVNKSFKNKLNINLMITILIYISIHVLLLTSFYLSILISETIYLTIYFLILINMYKYVQSIKGKYIEDHCINIKVVDNKRLLKEDEELSKEKEKIKKKFKILFGICIGISVLSFLYVVINYKNLPDTIITHWGSGGQPDAYSEKNIINVFFINIIDILLVIMFSIIGVGTVSGMTYIDTQNIDLNRKKAIKYLNGIGYSFFALTLSMQSITTVIPIFMVNQSDVPMILMLSGCIIPIFISVIMIYYYIMLGSLKPKDKTLYTIESSDENWIYGIIYYNKQDTNLTVEKRLGAGWSINMAHPLGKTICIITIIMIVLPLLISFL